ncbi:proteobacterial dedicated sortase system histidine kinase [Shewanella cyperi]|uniref:proteobacterial dedicated sortase system histidine kinase n=1 Tax=Shewanella cyperi TaxID=2814292 RepID=UPI001A948679|nr:proteobacterial dedicated sortase system histidine kinase [Shewanella cyperi]QSX42240.1 proteobacterial dedicated sortase system histidine kinase [Shewanella cyperi]
MTALPFGLRTKVILLSTFLLCLPWLGYEYVWEMEKYLRHGQERTLEGTTQALATALHERPKLFDSQASYRSQLEKGRDLYAYPLSSPIQLDGKLGDWDEYRHHMLNYGKDQRLSGQDSDSHLSFNHMVGKYGDYLYAFFEVTDPFPVMRGRNSLAIDRNDSLAIATLDPAGVFRRYLVANIRDGWISAFALPDDTSKRTPVEPELRIQGQWQRTEQGYNIELRIPLEMLGSKLSFAINDVNDKRTRQPVASVGTSATDDAGELGTVLVPSPEIENIIKGMGHNSARIWVVDRHGRVLARSGDIHSDNNVWTRAVENEVPDGSFDAWVRRYLYPLYYRILTRPPKDFVDGLKDSTELAGSHIQTALTGSPGSTWRLTPDNKAVVLAAASPIWIDNQVMGAVVAEETTHGIRTLRNRALEKLFNVILTVMSMGTLALFFFASSISSRIRRLRDQAEQAIDSQGRVRQGLQPSKVRDEIGDLSRSFASIVSRLGQYNHYLENMSSRLGHELRTPVAVVRSSLEHLALMGLGDDKQKYLDRAQEGVSRLSLILANMSEATRMEESLKQAEKQDFVLNQVIGGCVQGYQLTYPEQRFALELPGEPLIIKGVPEYLAQLLDKLVSNALEFCHPDTEIRISLSAHGKQAKLKVSNQGPLLPKDMGEQIFDSMVSVRPEGVKGKPHLGLGLYIARLISDFHQGEIQAHNLEDDSGVELTLALPLSPA